MDSVNECFKAKPMQVTLYHLETFILIKKRLEVKFCDLCCRATRCLSDIPRHFFTSLLIHLDGCTIVPPCPLKWFVSLSHFAVLIFEMFYIFFTFNHQISSIFSTSWSFYNDALSVPNHL